jgi:flagellar hook-associated protein 2
MASSSVDGLVSGLDTSTIISQLMQIERQPQTRLSAKKDAENKTIGIYQALNSRLAALGTNGNALASASTCPA